MIIHKNWLRALDSLNHDLIFNLAPVKNRTTSNMSTPFIPHVSQLAHRATTWALKHPTPCLGRVVGPDDCIQEILAMSEGDSAMKNQAKMVLPHCAETTQDMCSALLFVSTQAQCMSSPSPKKTNEIVYHVLARMITKIMIVEQKCWMIYFQEGKQVVAVDWIFFDILVFLGPPGPHLIISCRVLTSNEVSGWKPQNWCHTNSWCRHLHPMTQWTQNNHTKHLWTNVRFFLEIERSSDLNVSKMPCSIQQNLRSKNI